jgi:signal transduction histidine kinase
MGNNGGAKTRARAGSGRHSTNANGARSLPVLSRWTVSQRLFAVIALALIMGLVFGGLRVAAAEGSAGQFGRVSQLANLGIQDTVLIQALEDERDATAGIVTRGDTSSGTLGPLFAATDAAVTRVRQAAAGIGSLYPSNIRADVATVLADISPSRIAALHHTVQANENASAELDNYAIPITDMINLNDLTSQGVSDSVLTNDVRALNFLSLAKEEASRQRAVLYSLFNDPYFVAGEPSPNDSAGLAELNLVTTQEGIYDVAFDATATPAEQAMLTAALTAPAIGTAAEIEDFIVGNAPTQPANAPLVPNPLAIITVLGFNLKQAPQQWYTAMSAKVNAMRGVEATIAADIASRAAQLQRGAQGSALTSGVITAGVLLLVLVAALLVARSLVLPLRRLRAGALDIATVELPERVTQLSQSPESDPDLDVAPINVLTSDEIGQVARAFDQVHAEAVRLAGNEAKLRTSFNATFVNLSRRSQSLIERLALTIDSLEQNEDDPDRLSSLFSMDHMVTRMRRNSENLLLLAGHEGARKWSQPVLLADVARAATSEIEQYSRVVLDVQPGVAVVGPAVSDVVHMLAELIENATLFSPTDTHVLVTAQELSSSGVLIEVIDRGIGVSESRLNDMNWRLDNTPEMDVSVSRHMGLFAVSRLAERHGARVRLRPASPEGLSALVWLPGSLIQRVPRGYPTPVGWTHSFADQAGPAAWRPAGQASIGRRSSAELSDAVDDMPALLGAEPDTPAANGESLSKWFRSDQVPATDLGTGSVGRPEAGGRDAVDGPAAAAARPGDGWYTGIDSWEQQRRAAEIIAKPIRGSQTAAGLPVRVPQANLIPGSVGHSRPADDDSLAGLSRGPRGHEVTATLPQHSAESAELARSRLSGFQRGARRAESQHHRAGERTDS